MYLVYGSYIIVVIRCDKEERMVILFCRADKKTPTLRKRGKAKKYIRYNDKKVEIKKVDV